MNIIIIIADLEVSVPDVREVKAWSSIVWASYQSL